MLVKRGSISQIVIASTIAFSFLVAHMFTWPYKSRLDNIFRATTEAHVFITVYLALVLQYDLSYEGNAKTTYEHVMFWSFILFVPLAFLATIALKLRQLRRELHESNQGEDGLQAANALTARLHAFHLCRFGLADRSIASIAILVWCRTAGVVANFAAQVLVQLPSKMDVSRARGMITHPPVSAGPALGRWWWRTRLGLATSAQNIKLQSMGRPKQMNHTQPHGCAAVNASTSTRAKRCTYATREGLL